MTRIFNIAAALIALTTAGTAHAGGGWGVSNGLSVNGFAMQNGIMENGIASNGGGWNGCRLNGVALKNSLTPNGTAFQSNSFAIDGITLPADVR